MTYKSLCCGGGGGRGLGSQNPKPNFIAQNSSFLETHSIGNICAKMRTYQVCKTRIFRAPIIAIYVICEKNALAG